MKSILTIGFLAVVLVFNTQTAKAGDKERALIGGIVGGIIIGSVLADENVDARVSVGYRSHRARHYDSGYWSWVSVKTWVPGYYEIGRDRYGHRCKVWVPGYYTFTKQKVWVDGGHGYDYGRRGHGEHYEDHCETGRGHGRHPRGGYHRY